MPDDSAPPAKPTPVPSVTEIGPRVYGVFDLPRPDRIAGWAIDRANSAAAVEVEIHREGQLVATVRADRHRPDLEKGGVGTGNYGFQLDINPPMEPGFDFTLAVIARTADGTTGELKRTGAKAAPSSPEQRVVERLFEEVQRLGRVPPPAGLPSETIDRLAELMGRVELAQLRVEAALATLPATSRAGDGGIRTILLCTSAIALGSLGLGLYSLFFA